MEDNVQHLCNAVISNRYEVTCKRLQLSAKLTTLDDLERLLRTLLHKNASN